MANIHTPIPSLKLRHGGPVPMLAYGTGTVHANSNGTKSDDSQAVVDCVKMALAMGYTHIDCAESYNNEAEVGIAIKQSGIEREKLFITSKLEPLNAKELDGAVEKALESSLRKLQLEYLDLYLIHHPFFMNEDPAALQSMWQQMEAVLASGRVRSIGVSNCVARHLDTIKQVAKTPPIVNQIEFHPYLQHEPSLIDYHKNNSIATIAFAPLTPITKAAPGPVDDYLAALAKKYAVSPGEILIRYCIDQDIVAVTTSTKEQRLSDYLRAMTFKLTPKEIEEISRLGKEKHFRGFKKQKYGEDDRT